MGKTKQFDSTPHRKPNYGTTVRIPIIIMKKSGFTKRVLDGRYLNSSVGQLSEFWQLELKQLLDNANRQNLKVATEKSFSCFSLTYE